MKEIGSWVSMFLLGLLFIIMGFQGSLGKILACIFTPDIVEDNDNE